ncbi:MAG: hypothetical protein GXP41_12790 [Chloroflexi bacterium]|nr:hypothetical protein [Chloroflexota bacterium]
MIHESGATQQVTNNLLLIMLGNLFGGVVALVAILAGFVFFPSGHLSFSGFVGGAQQLANHVPNALVREAALWGLVSQDGKGISAFWYMSRSAGIVGYLLLWASVAWGLVISTKVLDRMVRRPAVFAWHEQISLAALGFGAFHALVLMGDHYIHFSLGDILIPFAASYQPVAVGLGTLGFYLALLVTASFYFRRYIGAKSWRKLHYLTFAVYILVTLHGFAVGSDTKSLVMKILYLGSMSVILFLVYYRLLIAAIPPVRTRSVAIKKQTGAAL